MRDIFQQIASHSSVWQKVRFNLEQVIIVQKSISGIAIPFFNLGVKWV